MTPHVPICNRSNTHHPLSPTRGTKYFETYARRRWQLQATLQRRGCYIIGKGVKYTVKDRQTDTDRQGSAAFLTGQQVIKLLFRPWLWIKHRWSPKVVARQIRQNLHSDSDKTSETTRTGDKFCVSCERTVTKLAQRQIVISGANGRQMSRLV